MIALDTNYLIMGLVQGSEEAGRLLSWAEKGETFCVSSIVWYEFICGPVTTEQENAMRKLLSEIVEFDEVLARQGAQLFNKIGRTRKLRVDTMIAAMSINKGIPFATQNIQDFARFSEFGLYLV